MSATNPTYQISYDLPIEANQADYELLSRIFETATINGECWEAAGYRNKVSGYIHLTIKNSYGIRYVHRFVCHLFHGLNLDYRQFQCHHLCQNKSCCRPSHLQPLSLAEHRAQTHADGCHRSGDAASWSILTEAQVVAYRLRYAAGETCPALAKEAEINEHTLYCALTGLSYVDVPGAVTDIQYRRDGRGEKHKKSKLKESDIPVIYTEYWTGQRNTVELAKRFRVSDESIRAIIHNKFWTHVPRPAVTIGRVKTSLRHYRIIKRKAA